jgi:predicted nuclease with TOPRIM domain
MDSDDQAVREILRALGAVESSTNDLKKQVERMGEKLDNVGVTCTNFEIFEEEYTKYKEERKGLPERTARLEDRVDAMEPVVQYLASKMHLLIAIVAVLQVVIVVVWWPIKDGYVRLGI